MIFNFNFVAKTARFVFQNKIVKHLPLHDIQFQYLTKSFYINNSNQYTIHRRNPRLNET